MSERLYRCPVCGDWFLTSWARNCHYYEEHAARFPWDKAPIATTLSVQIGPRIVGSLDDPDPEAPA